MPGKPRKQPSGLIIETHWSADKHVVVDRVRYRERALSEAQSERAKLPRTGNPIRATVVAAMRAFGPRERQLRNFIDAAKAGSIERIEEVTVDDDGLYSILCRDFPKEKLVTLSTLQKWWTEAGKPKMKKDR